jgi:hypothetical protein
VNAPMNTPMNIAMNTPITTQDNRLSTADLVNAARAPANAPLQPEDGMPVRDGAVPAPDGEQERLIALFNPELASQFKSHWDAIQIGFVDDPRSAVRQADELVAQVMTSLAESFAQERSGLEKVIGNEDGSASTENLRMALRRYRSFFQRLLSL